MISVVVPTYKNPKCLEICLRSFIDTSDNSISNIFCVIDGFVNLYENVISKYKEYKNIYFILNENNRGMPFSINRGVYAATEQYIFIINDDNVFPKNWDSILLSLMKEDRIVSPNQIESTNSIFNFIQQDFGSVDNFRYNDFLNTEPLLRINNPSLTQDGEIFPFCINKKVFMGIGGFDLIYPSPFVCDWDFFLKLELLNYKFFRTRSINFYHFGSISTKKSNDINDITNFNNSEIIARNIFLQKWGFEPSIHMPSNSHKPHNMPILINGIQYND